MHRANYRWCPPEVSASGLAGAGDERDVPAFWCEIHLFVALLFALIGAFVAREVSRAFGARHPALWVRRTWQRQRVDVLLQRR